MRRTEFLALVALVASAASSVAEEVAQTDWSGGPSMAVAVERWQGRFAQAEGVSWLAVPGQLALSSVPRTEPQVQSLARGQLQGAESVYAADIDGDGDIDVAGAGFAGEVSWWCNDGGDPIVWTRQVITRSFAGANQIFVTDLDGDGHNDVLGAAYEADDVTWWRNDGSNPISWSQRIIDSSFDGANSVYAADLDADGDQDVLSTAAGAGVSWWEQTGEGSSQWQRHTIDGSVANAHEVWAADLDGDGNLDVAASSWDGPRMAWWRNDGGDPIAWTRQIIDSGFYGGSSLDIADLDNDGDPDIVGAAQELGQVAWWRNDGGDPLSWTKQVLATGRAGAWSVLAADIDGDGRRDVLAAVWRDGDLIWWRNEGGSPISWQEIRLSSSYPGASAVHAADLDGDGDLEVLATGYELGDLRLWAPTDFVSWGQLTSQVLDIGTGLLSPVWYWSAEVPAGTILVLEARGGNSATGLGAWFELNPRACLAAFEGLQYVQYRLYLETSSPALSPILREVELGWFGVSSLPPRRITGHRLP